MKKKLVLFLLVATAILINLRQFGVETRVGAIDHRVAALIVALGLE